VPERTLSDVLDRALRALWPRRSDRERLLDLGEHKGWTDDDHAAAVEVAASWMVGELCLPPTLACGGFRPAGTPDDLRSLGDALGGGERRADGVSRWLAGLAPALGTTGKTLANSLAQGLRADLSYHRWLRLVLRLRDGKAAPDAWLYHRRTPSLVAAELAACAENESFDVGDALLLMSLLALWQRRRPTAHARGNRGAARARRHTPKPIAAMRHTLAAPGQLQHLGRLATLLDGDHGRALLLIAAEAGLTEAHLAPHRPRRSTEATTDGGEDWLRALEALLDEHAPLFGDDTAVLRFRIDAMRAYPNRTALLPPPAEVVRFEYVRASLSLMRPRDAAPPPETFRATTPGLMMLLPQLRARGFTVL
jgi:hypothetical protein